MSPIAAILSFAALVSLTTSYSITDETLAVTKSTFYPMGYPEEDYGVVKELSYKYKIMNPESLKALISEEWQIYNKLKKLKAKTFMDSEWRSSSFLRSVHEYMEDFEESSLKLVESSEDRNVGAEDIVAGNMLTVFLTVRRFVHYFQNWLLYENEINMTALEGSAFSKLKIYEMKNGPDLFDFQMTIIGIIMNQFQLDLKAEDIASGVIAGVEMSTKLRAVHCIDVGVYAFATAMYPIAIEWLELVVKKINEGDNTVSLDFASKWLHTAIRKHDDSWDPLASGALSSMYFERQLNLSSSPVAGLKWSKQVKSIEQIKSQDKVILESELPYYLHWNTCQGKMTQSDLDKSKLFCWYEHKIHPSFKIGPIKAELHSTFPRLEIVQYYELISDKAIDRLKQSVRSFLPTLYGTEDMMSFNPKKQCSVIGNPSYGNHESSKLENLITRVSGLKSYIRGGEITPRSQIVAYIPGGHSLVHEDWNGLDSSAGIHSPHWRIASFMVYLEEPQKGGETTFPYALVAVPPVKGSGVLAHNLLSSGVRDRHAPHGGCPVVMGNKYVWIKDIPYVNQVHKQCGMDPEARIEILVNGRSKFRRPEVARIME